jgi:hypothetical protein
MTNDTQISQIRLTALDEALPHETEPAWYRDFGAARQFKFKAAAAKAQPEPA